jgi:hypothetical protein
VFLKRETVIRKFSYTSIVRLILEYWASCWDPYREGQTNALDRVRKKATEFANTRTIRYGENLAQCWKIACIFVLFKTHTGKPARKSPGGRLEGPSISRDDHDCQIKTRKQRKDCGKFMYNRTIKLWNQLPGEALATLPCK